MTSFQLHSQFHKSERVEEGLKDSLKKLGLDYVDLFLIHHPVALKVQSSGVQAVLSLESSFDFRTTILQFSQQTKQEMS